MPISLFNSDDKPRKPSFFERVRSAVTGESTESATPAQEVPPVLEETAAPQNAFELPASEFAETLPAEALVDPVPVIPNEAVEYTSAPKATTPVPARVADTQRNEFGLKPMTSTFSFGGYASEAEEDASFMGKMRDAVERTRSQLGAGLDNVLALGRTVDEETLDELEAVLLTADIGSSTTSEIMRNLRQRALREKATTDELKQMLKEELRAILDSVEQPTNHPTQAPEVIMMVGVNGTGKTTTSGKLAALYGTHGRKALLCAADTFRAAAIEQLEVWAQRSGVDIIKTKQGGDPSAALYDSLTAGKARGADIVIVDTAGRLHNKAGLMAELDKMRRTAQKLVPGAPHQVFLVLDATTGQNGMQQARLFTESAGVTGIVLTKLDGTAKGGIVIAIARELKLPVVFAGVGEKMEDILPFNSDAFLDSLLG
ncbi:signal recognition particle-docking protein FtsY [Terriglobus roseus]|uniref:Signal recognition particle receptor FtsY n=1 Tax=Terriglobus roseus TaxID=392734 RepID=A0A1G7MPD4_9BACT|nr:signal recognition particle-docking protein FtsY [Terriglobus roseus]